MIPYFAGSYVQYDAVVALQTAQRNSTHCRTEEKRTGREKVGRVLRSGTLTFLVTSFCRLHFVFLGPSGESLFLSENKTLMLLLRLCQELKHNF